MSRLGEGARKEREEGSTMNLPMHRVHHIDIGYGRLLVPWFGGRWLMWMDDRDRRGRRLRLMSAQFHNCTRTGIY